MKDAEQGAEADMAIRRATPLSSVLDHREL